MNPSLTARISLLFAIGAALVLLLLGWVVARAVDAHFVEMDRHELDGKLALVRNLLARAQQREALAALPRQLDDALVGHHHLAVALIAPDGATHFASDGGRVPRALLTASPGGAARVWHWHEGDRHWRGLAADAASGVPGLAPHRVVLALDITHHERFMAEFRHALAWSVALAMLFTAALGWAATRAGLQPLRRITALAENLSASHLHQRLPEAPLPAEIRALAAAFNTMLARLEDSFRRLSEFSADLAHELRTPLSNLMTQTQVALTRARTLEEYRELLGSNLEEYERLARMTGDMLFLAQADNRLLEPRREPVALAAEVDKLFEFYDALAADRGVHLVRQGSADAMADRGMVRRALSNLLSNALRHCPADGTVVVALSRAAGTTRVEVANPGEIAAELLPRLFERFHTGDPARRISGEGAGLGLAIARSIARMHGGDLVARNERGQAVFTLTLP